MSILVNFEDTYGIADIALKCFCNTFMEKEYNEQRYGNVIVRRGLSTNGILRGRTIPKDVSTIVNVYNMDRQSPKDKYNFLEPNTLKMKIASLTELYAGLDLRFVPVAFSAETICLHMLRPRAMDFSKVFSTVNTAHLHTKILTDILTGIYTNRSDRIYWSSHGVGNETFNIKRTRIYLDSLFSVRDTYMQLQDLQFSEINKYLFDWLCSGHFDNVSNLPNGDLAIELQKYYKNIFCQFLQQHTEYIDLDGSSYALDMDYK